MNYNTRIAIGLCVFFALLVFAWFHHQTRQKESAEEAYNKSFNGNVVSYYRSKFVRVKLLGNTPEIKEVILTALTEKDLELGDSIYKKQQDKFFYLQKKKTKKVYQYYYR